VFSVGRYYFVHDYTADIVKYCKDNTRQQTLSFAIF